MMRSDGMVHLTSSPASTPPSSSSSSRPSARLLGPSLSVLLAPQPQSGSLTRKRKQPPGCVAVAFAPPLHPYSVELTRLSPLSAPPLPPPSFTSPFPSTWLHRQRLAAAMSSDPDLAVLRGGRADEGDDGRWSARSAASEEVIDLTEELDAEEEDEEDGESHSTRETAADSRPPVVGNRGEGEEEEKGGSPVIPITTAPAVGLHRPADGAKESKERRRRMKREEGWEREERKAQAAADESAQPSSTSPPGNSPPLHAVIFLPLTRLPVPVSLSDAELAADARSLSLGDSTPSSSTALAEVEAMVAEWQSLSLVEPEVRAVEREALLRVFHELVDECVAVAVLEGKMTAPLPLREREDSRRLLQMAPSSLVVSAFNVELRAKELRCLQPREWLNDEVINFYFQLLEQRQQRHQFRHRHTPRNIRRLPHLVLSTCLLTLFLRPSPPPCPFSGFLVHYPRCYFFNTSEDAAGTLQGGFHSSPTLTLLHSLSLSLPLPLPVRCISFFYAKLLDQGRYAHKNVARWTRKVQAPALARISSPLSLSAHSPPVHSRSLTRPLLSSSAPRAVQVDLFSYSRVFLPVHVHGNHWCLGCVNVEEKRVEYYDSLGGHNAAFFTVRRTLTATRSTPLHTGAWDCDPLHSSALPSFAVLSPVDPQLPCGRVVLSSPVVSAAVVRGLGRLPSFQRSPPGQRVGLRRLHTQVRGLPLTRRAAAGHSRSLVSDGVEEKEGGGRNGTAERRSGRRGGGGKNPPSSTPLRGVRHGILPPAHRLGDTVAVRPVKPHRIPAQPTPLQ